MNNSIIFKFGSLKLVGTQKADGSVFKVFWDGVYQELITSKEKDLDVASERVTEQLMGVVL